MKYRDIEVKSKPGEFNKLDAKKTLHATLWSALSAFIWAVGLFIATLSALDVAEIPMQLLFLIPFIPFINGMLYGINRRLKDNR